MWKYTNGGANYSSISGNGRTINRPKSHKPEFDAMDKFGESTGVRG